MQFQGHDVSCRDSSHSRIRPPFHGQLIDPAERIGGKHLVGERRELLLICV